jgi:hypothetical protein
MAAPTNRTTLIVYVMMVSTVLWLWFACAACGSSPSPPPSQAGAGADNEHDHDDDRDDHDDAGPEGPSPSASGSASSTAQNAATTTTTTTTTNNNMNNNAPERTRPRSTATYEEAMAHAEPIDVHDERQHLSDIQLTGPMRGVITGCRVPGNARITIRTAVQLGRAIGVTVNVRFERPKPVGRRPPRPPTRAELKAEAKLTAKIIKCVDGNVRDVVWPPNRRRDSFTMNF